MYPNQPTPPPYQPPSSPTPQPPVDYLNQIATPPPQPSLFSGKIKKLIIIGAILVVSVIILSIVTTIIAGTRKAPAEQLSARLTSTQKIAEDSQANLKSSQLRSLNSNLRLFFTNTQRDIATPLATFGVTAASVNKDTVAKETASAEATAQRLEDARLNAVYDRTYAREMAYQLSTILTLLQQAYNASGSESARTFLETTYDNLEPIQQGFADFNEITS